MVVLHTIDPRSYLGVSTKRFVFYKFKRFKQKQKENKQLKEQQLLEKIKLIYHSGIDFSKRGCFTKANKILKFKETSDAIKWLKRNTPELLKSHP